jgi:hypothetical protein
MADPAAIAAVKLLLPADPETYDLTDDILGAQLDATTQTKTVLFGLRAIAAKIASIEDVSESGSSRTHRFHDRLMAMIADYQARADAEDKDAGLLPAREHGASHRAVRV